MIVPKKYVNITLTLFKNVKIFHKSKFLTFLECEEFLL